MDRSGAPKGENTTGQIAPARRNGLMGRCLRWWKEEYRRWKERHRKEDCSKLPGEEKTADQIALARCDCLMDQYLRWKKENYRNSNRAQGTALFLTAMIPVLLLIPCNYVNILAALFSAVAAIATGLLAIHGWRENYIRYGYVWHRLQTEKYRYLTRATKEYSGIKERAAQNFASQIEDLVMAEVADWRSEMQRVEQKK